VVLCVDLEEFGSLTGCIDGLPPVLWLYQYKGTWFENKRKTAITILNFGLFFLGFAMVSLLGISSNLVSKVLD